MPKGCSFYIRLAGVDPAVSTVLKCETGCTFNPTISKIKIYYGLYMFFLMAVNGYGAEEWVTIAFCRGRAMILYGGALQPFY